MLQLVFVGIYEQVRKFADSIRSGLRVDVVVVGEEIFRDAPENDRVVFGKRDRLKLSIANAMRTRLTKALRIGERERTLSWTKKSLHLV